MPDIGPWRFRSYRQARAAAPSGHRRRDPLRPRRRSRPRPRHPRHTRPWAPTDEPPPRNATDEHGVQYDEHGVAVWGIIAGPSGVQKRPTGPAGAHWGAGWQALRGVARWQAQAGPRIAPSVSPSGIPAPGGAPRCAVAAAGCSGARRRRGYSPGRCTQVDGCWSRCLHTTVGETPAPPPSRAPSCS